MHTTCRQIGKSSAPYATDGMRNDVLSPAAFDRLRPKVDGLVPPTRVEVDIREPVHNPESVAVIYAKFSLRLTKRQFAKRRPSALRPA